MESFVEKSKFKHIIILAVIVVSISSLLAFFIIAVAKDVLGIKNNDICNEVIIPKGASTTQISKILKDNQIINHPFVFKLYSKFKKIDNTFRDGKYILNSKMSYNDIIFAFQNMSERDDIIKVTIPEGYSVNQIALLLKESGVIKNKQDFLDEINSQTVSSKALKLVKDNDLVCFKLEGYLFPDTYEFILNEQPNFLIKKMLQNFDKKVFDKLNSKIKNSDMSLSQVITLASIIQRESNSSEVMKKVASVFFNRLNNMSLYPKLQSDVTILYIESDIKPNLQLKNQKMYDSYNTYVCQGLPIGPICNPGLDAIEAVLDPDETDYFYFLTDVNNNYYWAKTLAEHNNNLYKASKIGDVKGLDTN